MDRAAFERGPLRLRDVSTPSTKLVLLGIGGTEDSVPLHVDDLSWLMHAAIPAMLAELKKGEPR